MQAERKLARVPASRARKPSRARSCRRSGARAPMPPSWMPIELKLANPQRAKLAITNERLEQVRSFKLAELLEGDQLVEHRARAQQPAHGAAVFPGHAHHVGDRRQDPAEDRLERGAELPQAEVDQRDQPQERDQHGRDVQGQVQPVARPAGRRVQHVGVGPIVGRAAPCPGSRDVPSRAPASWTAGSRRGPS